MLYIKFIELVIVYYAGRMKKVENFKKVLIYQICVPAVPVNLFPVPNKFSCCSIDLRKRKTNPESASLHIPNIASYKGIE